MARTTDKVADLERRAAAGDAGDVDLEREKLRAYGQPYDHLIGKWIFHQGVRQHYRGRLLHVIYRVGRADLFMHPLYDLATHSQESPSPDANDAEERLNTSEDAPGVVSDLGALSTTLQPKRWPEK